MSKGKIDYNKLDQMIRDSDNAGRQSGGGVWVEDRNHPNGGFWVNDSADLEKLRKSVDDIERYLRS